MIKRKMKNKILTIGAGTTILLTSIVLGLGTPHAYAQSHYQIGYDDGCPGRVILGAHTLQYDRGYADGKAACSGGSSPGGDNNIPRPIPNTRPQPLPNNFGSSPSSDNNQNWANICNQIESLLVESCDQLVNSYGSLTADGQRAHDCIQNGILLGGSALTLTGGNVGSLPLIIGGLKILSSQTGCDNIVNWDSLDSNQLSLLTQIFHHHQYT
jgi:hypothetical protein